MYHIRAISEICSNVIGGDYKHQVRHPFLKHGKGEINARFKCLFPMISDYMQYALCLLSCRPLILAKLDRRSFARGRELF